MSQTQQYLEWFRIPSQNWRQYGPGVQEEREFQQSDAYKAENDAWKTADILGLTEHKVKLEGVVALQKFINKVMRYKWFLRRWPQTARGFMGGKDRPYENRVHVLTRREGFADNWCHGHYGRREVDFANNSAPIWIVLHELAHALTPYITGGGHGRYWARAYLELVRHVLGEQYAKLLVEGYKKFGVKYNPKRKLKEETREKLRENFKARLIEWGEKKAAESEAINVIELNEKKILIEGPKMAISVELQQGGVA